MPEPNPATHAWNGGSDDRSDTRNLDARRGAVAGILLWFATQVGAETSTEYWATYGLIAAAGLTMALSQLLGGWTKWGWPRFSRGVFVLGFLPVLVAGGWVLLARQPADWMNTSNWSRDLGVDGLVADLGNILPAIAFGIGLDVRAHVRHRRPAPRGRRDGRTCATTHTRDTDAPLTADPEPYATPVPAADTRRDADARRRRLRRPARRRPGRGTAGRLRFFP